MKIFKIFCSLAVGIALFCIHANALALQPYPYAVAYFKIENQGQSLKMAYMDIQPKKANGQTVLLLHGKYFNGRYWQEVIQHLSGAGYRVVVPDQIGFGQSSQPNYFQYSFQQLAMNTRDLLEYLHINRVIVIGHSMGGMLATRFALMFPRLTTALVLEDPIGLEDWRRYIPYHTVMENYQNELKQTPETVKQYEKISYYHGNWKPEYGKWINIDLLSSPDYKHIAWNSALQSDMIFTQPVMYEFKDLKIPVLLIIGELDRTVIGRNWASNTALQRLGNYPVLGKLTAAEIPNAQLVLISGVGHIPHIENPTAFYNAVMPFLGKLIDYKGNPYAR